MFLRANVRDSLSLQNLACPWHRKRQSVVGFCFAISAAVIGLSGFPAFAEDYQPLFTDSMLQSLDPATRKRFGELEEENRRRWRNQNPQTRNAAAAAAQHQHEETEAMLRRFEESRRLENLANAENKKQNAVRSKRCKSVAAEIKGLSAGGLLYERGADGQRRYLSDKEVETRLESQKKSYKKFCRRSRR